MSDRARRRRGGRHGHPGQAAVGPRRARRRDPPPARRSVVDIARPHRGDRRQATGDRDHRGGADLDRAVSASSTATAWRASSEVDEGGARERAQPRRPASRRWRTRSSRCSSTRPRTPTGGPRSVGRRPVRSPSPIYRPAPASKWGRRARGPAVWNRARRRVRRGRRARDWRLTARDEPRQRHAADSTVPPTDAGVAEAYGHARARLDPERRDRFNDRRSHHGARRLRSARVSSGVKIHVKLDLQGLPALRGRSGGRSRARPWCFRPQAIAGAGGVAAV